MSLRILLVGCAVAMLGGLFAAEPPAPPPPERYDVVVHYRIVAFPNERILQFNDLMAQLAAKGFRRDPNEVPPEDEAVDVHATRLHGTVPAANARALLQDRHVQCLFLMPAGEKLPGDANEAVRVNFDLANGLPPDRQRLLHDQTADALHALKFSEAIGYDHRGFTRLVGSLPAGQLAQALDDLRTLPSGRTLPAPFASVRAVRILEVHPEQPAPAARPAPTAVPPGQEKLSSDLREAIGAEGAAGKPVRLEILLADAPPGYQHGWERLLRSAARGIALEGQIGSLVTATMPPEQIPALASLPEVVALRLPRTALPAPFRPAANSLASLVAGGLERLHTPGYRGAGTSIGIVAADFSGWQALVGKGLPKGTRFVDFTLERNANLEPDPFPPGSGPGQGTLFAQAIASAVPEAEIVLLRVDPAAPYMLQSIARAVHGEPSDSLALLQRGQELADERSLLEIRRAELLQERRQVFEDLHEDDASAKRRDDYLKKQADLDRLLAEFDVRVRRYIDHETALLHLKGLRAIASTLLWDTRAQGGGSNPVSRFLGDRPFGSTLWLQATDPAAGAVWTGLYRDADGDGAMEFAVAGTALPPDSWSPQLNFLGWRTPDGKLTPDLPEGTKIRITLQWREAHDAALLRIGQDLFREPLSSMKLLLLRQPDPAGTKRPADDLEQVAESTGVARRLDQAPSSATYEVSLEYRVAAPGRFALRVEGRLAESDRPASLPTLPILRRISEIRPRITVETIDGAGRAVWRDFVGDVDERPGSAGVPPAAPETSRAPSVRE